jgi:hypothetical protein
MMHNQPISQFLTKKSGMKKTEYSEEQRDHPVLFDTDHSIRPKMEVVDSFQDRRRSLQSCVSPRLRFSRQEEPQKSKIETIKAREPSVSVSIPTWSPKWMNRIETNLFREQSIKALPRPVIYERLLEKNKALEDIQERIKRPKAKNLPLLDEAMEQEVKKKKTTNKK